MLKKIARNFNLTLVFLITATIANLLSSKFIPLLFPHRPLADDLLFSLTPPVMWTQYLSEPLLIIEIIALTWIIWKKTKLSEIGTKDLLHHMAFFAGFYYWLRAIMIPLTPLLRPETSESGYGILKNVFIQNGMFPSGHTALALFFYFYSKKLKAKKSWNAFFFIMFVSQVVILILSRGHYSIDIAGGIMIAYIGYRKTEDYLDVTNKKQSIF